MTRKSRLLRLLMTFVCSLVFVVAAGWIALWTFQPVYQATCILEENTDFLLQPLFADRPLESLAVREREILFNPIVLDPVLSDPSIRDAVSLSNPETAEPNLRRNLSIESAGSRSRMTISYIDPDPTSAATVCNGITESYLRQRNFLHAARISNLERVLEPEIARVEQRVEEATRRVEKLRNMTDLAEFDLTGNPLPRLKDKII
ncbi:MAG: hypothetical protein AAGI63_15140, partial [Planctomycetota bacterium]